MHIHCTLYQFNVCVTVQLWWSAPIFCGVVSVISHTIMEGSSGSRSDHIIGWIRGWGGQSTTTITAARPKPQ